MASRSRAVLIKKLNKLAYRSLESATSLCKLRGNPYVELAHLIQQILQQQNSDLHRIVAHFGINEADLSSQLTATLDALPRGATSISDFSPAILDGIERAWGLASLLYNDGAIRTGHLVLALLQDRMLRGHLLQVAEVFSRINAERLEEGLQTICAGSPEGAMSVPVAASTEGAASAGDDGMAMAGTGPAEALNRFTVDLTAQARSGTLDPIVGRDDEIRQLVDILMRRRQNNPILTGEAGVGKTAIVEGFAQRIVRGDVPPSLKDVELRTLDLGILQAGAGVKGEFEKRLRQIIEEVQSSPRPIILFIDEVHTLLGAGGAAGTGDAANLLKPALARGTLRTIGATTWAEYKKYFEKDPALTRRFQVVQVDEPDETKAVLMMRGVASAMEKHHQVQILDEALEAAVRLSHRYIPARQLPDKAVSLLDTASARVAVSLHATPAQVDDSRKRIEALEVELGIIGREKAIGIEVAQRESNVTESLQQEKARLATLEARWQSERQLVDELLGLRARLRAGALPVEGTGSVLEDAAAAALTLQASQAASAADRDTLLARLHEVQDALAQIQGESPLILPTVDYQAVCSVVGDWTGIPVGRMARNEIEMVLGVAKRLGERVIGQDHAMEVIAKRIQTSRAGLDNPGKPIGVFLLVGTSGVGKTETALALAETLYGGEQNLITINMSEFQEAHTVSTLKGAPPGYVGYGEGGVMTEAVRRKPYSVLLLDEIEKAHPDVYELFFQVFDKGFMEDGEGRFIDFKNTLILLTTNAGTDMITRLCADPELMPDPEGMTKALREPLLKIFPPALLGRLITVPFYPLADDVKARIVELQLQRIGQRVETRYKVPFEYGRDVVDLIVSRCVENESGGRIIDAILTNTMLPDISREVLTRMMEGRAIERVAVQVSEGTFAYRFESADAGSEMSSAAAADEKTETKAKARSKAKLVRKSDAHTQAEAVVDAFEMSK